MHLRKRRTRLAGIATLAALALGAAGCGSGGGGSSPPSATPVKGGTASFYIVAGAQPNWIWPFMSLANFSVYNSQYFQFQMYRPLYWFGGPDNQPTVDYNLSVAEAPVYSNGGKTVTINLKGWKWSNGETVNAKDVIFWLNMMNGEFANWAASVPGGIPQNIASYSATGPLQVTLQLKQAYSSLWYTYNELSQVTPMPMAWDVTAAGAAAGSGGCTTDTAADNWAKCKAVYNFLNAQSKDTSSYTTSPIWSVVDGPWKLSTFTTDGNDSFVPNPKYSGSPKPHLAEFKFVPFTDDSAVFTGIKAGQVDIGQIPSQDLPVKPVSQALPSTNPAGPNYNLMPFYIFGINYYQVNWNNSTFGPVFKQLYFRQAMEYLDDQVTMAKTIYRGYGYPTTGPAPLKPPNQWVPPVQQGAGPYPFSVSKAKSLLTSHGWSEVGGVMTCTNPAQCGPGIKKGLQLKLNFDYASGVTVFTEEAQTYKSDAAKAGIILNTTAKSFNTIIGEAVPTNHSWQMAMYGGWVYAPDYEPTGGELFATGAGSNGGAYSDPNMDKLIQETHTNGSLSVYHQFATYAAQQLPYIWMPNRYRVYAVNKNLHGVVLNPLFTIMPEYWYFTKS